MKRVFLTCFILPNELEGKSIGYIDRLLVIAKMYGLQIVSATIANDCEALSTVFAFRRFRIIENRPFAPEEKQTFCLEKKKKW